MIYVCDENKTWMPLDGNFVEIFDEEKLEKLLGVEIYEMRPHEIWDDLIERKENPSDWMIMQGCPKEPPYFIEDRICPSQRKMCLWVYWELLIIEGRERTS